MTVELASKKRVRAGHRASTTRFLGQVDAAITSAPLDVAKINQLKRSLEDKLTSLNTLDEGILTLTPEEAIEDEIIQADEVREQIYTALSRLELALKSVPVTTVRTESPLEVPVARTPAKLADTATTDGTSSVHDSATVRSAPAEAVESTTEAHARGARVKLPKITLPRFNGDPVRWTSFWDSYQSAIHLNSELTEVDKFNYLRSLLDHSAYDAIAGLTLSSANYQQAVEILSKRFGNKQVIISKHMDLLMNTDPISSDRHLKDLRRLYDHTESHVRSLKSLGIEAASYGALLSPVLLAKLPPDLRLIVSRKVSSSNLDMDALLSTFEEELTARERACPQLVRQTAGKPHHSSSALFTSTSNSKAEPQCCYCQRSHPSASCTSVTKAADRKHILLTSGRCFNCLRRSHVSRNCKSASRCQKCNRKHHTSICDAGRQHASTPHRLTEPALNPEAEPFTTVPTTTTLCTDNVQTVFLQTARAVIHHPDKPHISMEVRLILDGGSQKSYLSERARDRLKLEPSKVQSLSIATFGSSSGCKRVCPIVNVGMCIRGYPSMSLCLYVMPTICEPLVGQPVSMCVSQHPHLSGLKLADSSAKASNMPIDMLVGSDYYWQLVTGSICRGASGPVAVHTKLGWVLSGPSSLDNYSQCSTNLSVSHVLHFETHPVEQCTLEDQLRAFWELEALGIREEERTLFDDFASSVKFEKGRYKVTLPWKEFHDPLPDNHQLSVSRLQGLLRRLKQEPAILEEYARIIQDQLTNGIIEAVQPDETPPGVVHYLPHHAVVRRDKTTTKVRIVYDASARSANGPSLNDCLNKGPKFNQLIFDLLVRFRAYKVALTADLEKAFLMVSVEEADRDVLRFLWVKDLKVEPPQFNIYRFTRVVFGVSSSPFLLNATIRLHLEKYLRANEHQVRKLLRSTYVDDVIAGGETEEEAFELYAQSKQIFREGGFNLRKFLTNSRPLQERIDFKEDQCTNSPSQGELSYSEATLGTAHPSRTEEHKVLGVPWNPASDRFLFDTGNIAQLALDLSPTKRNLVSLIGKFYDPLGFLSPVIIRFKILFQKLCQCESDWDEVIPGELESEWQLLVSDLRMASPLSLPRSYSFELTDSTVEATLRGFCDASTRAYAAVVYLVLKTETRSSVQFVAAKTRVAPLKSQTIPRLELLSALLLSKLIVSVHSSLQHQIPSLSMKCYTDSQVALYWILGSDKEWKPFVQNRVAEIRRKVHSSNWYHCPGHTNPADLPSRGITMVELSVNQLWRSGPEWLELDVPLHSSDSLPMPESCSQELKLKAIPSHNLLTVENTNTIGGVMCCEDYGNLQKLLRVTAHVLQAVKQFKVKRSLRTSLPHTPTPQEIAVSVQLWVTHVQKELVQQKDYGMLKKQLSLFCDEKGLWRCGGRLQNADIPYEARHPILLPRSHHFTGLVIRDAHIRVCHNGVKETLTEVRSRYWIIKGRSLTRSLLHKCTTCRRYEGAPFHGPPPPPLPEFRVKDDPAFTYTGVDFAGPLIVRNGVSGDNVKVWICVFSCLVTRAIHLDITGDLSTETFLRCLKRFAARRGLPRKFLSDNGKTFQAAARFLRAVFSDRTIQEYLSAQGSQWIFNVECAPWWGGVFERMVRSTKRCLRKMIGRASFTSDELLTAVVEIEAVINSRPLSYISATDIEEPLTPSHLIVGRRILSLPDHLGYVCDPGDEDFEVNASQLTKRMKHFASVLNHFWRRWRSEYLNELRESHRHGTKNVSNTHVTTGEVVIVHDDSLPRGLWKLGRVLEVIPGADGLPRCALVRVARRDKQHVLLKRPVQLLYPLEISQPQQDKIPQPQPDKNSQPPPDNNPKTPNSVSEPLKTCEPVGRPVRAAAKKAAEKQQVWIEELQNYE